MRHNYNHSAVPKRAPIKVADYKRPPEYSYAMAIDSKFMHLAKVKYISLCFKTVDTVGIGVASLMCPRCVAKAGSRTRSIR